MSALYPTSTITFTTKTNKVDIVDAAHVNSLQEEVQSIEQTLGKNPQGSATNVVSRLNRFQSSSGDYRQGTTFPVSDIGDGTPFWRTDLDVLYIYDGSSWDAQSGITNYASGDYLIASADTSRSDSGSSYVKKKEVYVPRSGTLKIKFTLAFSGGAGSIYGRVYRNGVAVGTEQSEGAGTTEFTESISGWSSGDLCQLYFKSNGSSNSCSNFRIYENSPVKEIVTLD